ncbi:MAG TPA: hypothetical protein VF377_01290 [Acidimicrobiia bacterium]|jgi:hypothetical protein
MSSGKDLSRERPLDPRQALAEADRIGTTVRRRIRWNGWVWLVIAIATPLFWLGTWTNWLSRPLQFWVAVGFLIVAAMITVVAMVREARRGVVDRRVARMEWPITWAYMAVVFVMAVLVIVFDTSEAPLWFVLGALATAVPGLVGAWRTLVR